MAASEPTASLEPHTGLRRALTGFDATLLVIGSILGGGIFLTPASIARELPSPLAILLAWLAGGLLTIGGGFVYAELGALFPEAGGMYVYLREAYGRLPGFLFAWIYYLIVMAGGVAAIATSFAEYLGALFPSLSTGLVVFSAGGLRISAGQLVAAGAILVLSATHYVGVEVGARVQGLFTLLIALTVAGLAAGGLLGGGAWSVAWGAGSARAVTTAAFGAAMVSVLWTYDGWNNISAVAGEVREPTRNIPRALLLGTGLVMLLYLGVNLVYMRAIPVGEMPSVPHVARVTAERLFGSGAGVAVAVAIVAAAFGCTSANLVAGPRVVWALSRDGLFLRPFGKVHPRFKTPSVAIVVQAVWAALLCLSGRYEALYTYTMFAAILAYAATGVSLFVFRRRFPDRPRPFRVWGYPVIPALYVLGTFFFLASIAVTSPTESLAGLAILLLGIPAYAVARGAGRVAKPSL